MDSKQKYKVIGLMSGTSLDGVDVVCCIFQNRGDKWTYKVEKAITIAYTDGWYKKLLHAHELSGEELLLLHQDYGKFLGNLCKKFVRLYGIKSVDCIASHGHTIFHQPGKGLTFQLGDGNAIHAEANIPVIYDFRSLDVNLGGQGAPLVPLGDQYLFSEYDICLNLGGIANLSRMMKGKRIAFDICYVNMGINYLASLAGKDYDDQGNMASDGELNRNMLNDLRNIYKKIREKRPSLGREFFEKNIRPVLDQKDISLDDRLHTFTESAAIEIAAAVSDQKRRAEVLCTGGGTFNAYLIYRLMEHCGDDIDLIIPDQNLIKFKEAIVFAFLGVRRLRNEINCLKSVTGASRDSSSGILVGF